MKPQNQIKNYLSKIIYFFILTGTLFFFSSAGFRDTLVSGWYQQFFPNLNGSAITGITFLDSLTGYAVTNPGTTIYCYILKTTNGGDNWSINYTYNSGTDHYFRKILFVDINTGYASTNYNDFFKTTNAGLNWFTVPIIWSVEDMAVLNKDTILYDVTGKEIKTLMNERKTRGSYNVRFDAGNLSSGVYFYRLSVDDKNIATKKMVLLK